MIALSEEICDRAINEGFYGSIWGSGGNPKPEDIKFLNFDRLEKVYYSKDHTLAGIGLPSCYSCEGYLYVWYLEDFGRTWWLGEEEDKRA